VDPAASVSGYRLYRSDEVAGPYAAVATLNVTATSSVTFVDNVPTDRDVYYYYISTLDSCGIPVLNSQVSNTILLKGVAGNDYTNTLEWNEYAAWPTGVNRYNLYMTMDGATTQVTLPSLTLPYLYIDSVLDNYYSDGEFCYTIEAIEEQGNPQFFLDSSRSNEVCLVHPPMIYIPNAFHPGGYINETFFVSNAFVSSVDYSLDIFNRWGKLVFHTNDPLEGWSGTTDGVLAPEGVYVYKLKAKNAEQEDIEKVGSVTLIR
jgi:gliding motility-associated-like protein